jgi:hypothetical protein
VEARRFYSGRAQAAAGTPGISAAPAQLDGAQRRAPPARVMANAAITAIPRLRAAGQHAGLLVDEHLIAPGGGRGIALGAEVLVAGGHSPVADPHGPRLYR